MSTSISAMAAADISEKTGDEIAQEMLDADVALGKRMLAQQLLHQLKCSSEVVPDKECVERELMQMIEERGTPAVACQPGFRLTSSQHALYCPSA